jgi:hypothetical protein
VGDLNRRGKKGQDQFPGSALPAHDEGEGGTRESGLGRGKKGEKKKGKEKKKLKAESTLPVQRPYFPERSTAVNGIASFKTPVQTLPHRPRKVPYLYKREVRIGSTWQ